jgi:hypothetical protein
MRDLRGPCLCSYPPGKEKKKKADYGKIYGSGLKLGLKK